MNRLDRPNLQKWEGVLRPLDGVERFADDEPVNASDVGVIADPRVGMDTKCNLLLTDGPCTWMSSVATQRGWS